MPHISRLAAALVAALMAMALALPAMASHTVEDSAAGVVAAVVHVDRTLNNLDIDVLNGLTVTDVHVIEVKDSLNNVLRNARFLNDITILQDFLNDPDCSVIAVCDSLNSLLEGANVIITDVVAIDVLSGGDINVYVQPQA